MKQIRIEWKDACPEGSVEVIRGSLESMEAVKGSCLLSDNDFKFSSNGPCSLELEVVASNARTNDRRTFLTIHEKSHPFSFFIDDVKKRCPLYVPEYGIVVLEASDSRDYAQVEKEIKMKGLVSQADRILQEPEESFKSAESVTRDMPAETWLGTGRDVRIFALGFLLKENKTEVFDWIAPRFHFFPLKKGKDNDIPVKYKFLLGRGISVTDTLTRRLEDGILPILHACRQDGGIDYMVTAFATLEKSRLCKENLIGTHYLVAESFADGFTYTEEQKKLKDALYEKETHPDEEIVLYYRVDAKNNTGMPRYAWFRAVEPNATGAPSNVLPDISSRLEGETGFGLFDDDSVFCISKLDGEPVYRLENAVLVEPGEYVRFEFVIPHSPVSKERACVLAMQDFDEKHRECRAFWKEKLDNASHVELPEKKINELLYSGILHLDMLCYGHEPDDTLAPTVGVYAPIGSESAPIIQAMDSMGWHRTARRALAYFLDKQHDDGFMQNFSGYMLETGAALWSMGEHYRYTRDDSWVAGIKEKLLKSCQYMIDWSDRNKRDDLKDKGYGMMDGKVADPVDNDVRFYMLNGYSYLGLSRVSEMLRNVDPAQSVYLSEKAEELKGYIRQAFFDSLGVGPLVPISDGTWCPTIAPFAGYPGALCLYAGGRDAYTHCAFTTRDGLLGPMHTVFQEIIGPSELAVSFMVKYYNEILFENNVAFTQPYYSSHPWVHLKRGEVELFLKNYYCSLGAIIDRETYTFKEGASYFSTTYKTHEEGWFLMQTRWMLYMEDGETLRLLGGIPRDWMKDGQSIKVGEMASYFGPISFEVQSHIGEGRIEAEIECGSPYKPVTVEIRLPHPEGKKAMKVSGGTYDESTETVRIDRFGGKANVVLEF